MGNHIGAYRVEFDLARELFGIQLALAKYCFEAPLKDVPDKIMCAVEVLRVTTVEVAHASRKISVHGFQQGVEMVGHLAVGQHSQIESVAGLAQECQPGQPVTIGAEDLIFPVAARSDMVERIAEFDS